MTLNVKDCSGHLSFFSFLWLFLSLRVALRSVAAPECFAQNMCGVRFSTLITHVSAVIALCVLLRRSNAYEGDILNTLVVERICPLHFSTADQQIPFFLSSVHIPVHTRKLKRPA